MGARFGPNMRVEIGSQDDPQLWARIAREHAGGFDIILDDGSHYASHIVATLKLALPLLRPGGVYLIEDLTTENAAAVRHLLLSGTSPSGSPEPLGGAIAGARMDWFRMLWRHDGAPSACCNLTSNDVQAQIEYITMYPMMLAIRKREVPHAYLHAPRHGTQWIPYDDAETNAKYNVTTTQNFGSLTRGGGGGTHRHTGMGNAHAGKHKQGQGRGRLS